MSGTARTPGEGSTQTQKPTMAEVIKAKMNASKPPEGRTASQTVTPPTSAGASGRGPKIDNKSPASPAPKQTSASSASASPGAMVTKSPMKPPASPAPKQSSTSPKPVNTPSKRTPSLSGTSNQETPGLTAKGVPVNGLRLPEGFLAGGSEVYFFDAKQRGDMYHIRAWQVLAALRKLPPSLLLPTVIYGVDENDESSKAIAQFLTARIDGLGGKDVPRIFETSMSYDQIVGRVPVKAADAGKSEWTPGWTDRYGPANCTMLLAANPMDFQAIVPRNMLPPMKDFAQVGIDVHSYFPKQGGPKPWPVALILWRNGRSPYPELNTGVESAKQLAALLKAKGFLPAFIDVLHDDETLRSALKSDSWAHCSERAYFEDEKIKPAARDSKLSTRDLEAAFIRHAYATNQFSIVVGMRSGALDLMTFLGIPTLSIGLHPMQGDTRMLRLTGREFRRVNVEYITPRHAATKKFPDGDRYQYKSPDIQKGLEITQPNGFSPADQETVKRGLNKLVELFRPQAGAKSTSRMEDANDFYFKTVDPKDKRIRRVPSSTGSRTSGGHKI